MTWDAATITALGALITGVASCLMAWASVINAKHKAADECEQRLHAVRLEAEHDADELHALRMQRAHGP